MVLLATNLAKNIDAAFVRRIHVSVEFGLPEEAERRAIWALSFPPDCPTEGLDLDWLAHQFKIAGGPIESGNQFCDCLLLFDGLFDLLHSFTQERGIQFETIKLVFDVVNDLQGRTAQVLKRDAVLFLR